MEFKGKVAVVAGGATGIGRATAIAFARHGAAVVIGDVNDEEGSKTAARIRQDGGQAAFVPTDVTIDHDGRKLAEHARASFGGIDILFNNSGIQTYGTVTDTPEDVWDRTIAVNLKGVYLCSKYCIPEIEKRGGGAVVNMASVQGLATQKSVAAYAAAKGGVIALTRNMALDYAPKNIRVNCVCPASIDTPMLRYAANRFSPDDPERAIQEWGTFHALRRVGRPEEVAELVLFLASARASFITGAAYLVDGGMLASFANPA